MKKRIRFERRANEQMDDIADWTVATFGRKQAEIYAGLLISRIEKLAKGVAHAKPIGPNDPRRAMLAGQHVVIFSETGDTITILAILHSRSDYLTHLDPLKDD